MGTKSELMVAADLMSSGEVSIPVNDSVYDLIYDHSGELYKVQVKTTLKDGSRNRIERGRTNESYAEDEIDILALVHHKTGQIAYWPWVGKNVKHTITMWFNEELAPKGNPYVLNLADEYTIEEAIESLK